MKKDSIYQEVIIILLIVVFAYPGMNKLLEIKKFEEQLSFSPLLPEAITPYLAWIIPILLISLAGLLLITRIRPLVLKAYIGLMGLFTLYIIAILTVASFIPCSCIGFSDRLSWQQQLIMNVIVLILSLFTLSFRKETKHQVNPGNAQENLV